MAPRWTVQALTPGNATACDAIVASLPYHFASEAGRVACARAVREQSGLVGIGGAGDVAGFLTWRPWYSIAREITWMAVDARVRGSGLGRILLDHLAADSAPSHRYLVVTTLSETVPEPEVADGYERTRRFYRRNGFEPLWEPAGWWNAENQAVVMVRALD
jgi:ribosomal protein S18 acetylase RimI-like enzyme